MKLKNAITSFTALAIWVHASLLNAQETTKAENTAEIKAMYDNAIALDRQGQSGEAAQIFRELILRTHRLEYYYNVGQCEISRDRFDLAYEAFTRYVDEVGNKVKPHRLARAKRVIAASTAQIGFLKIAENSSSQLLVDGEQRGALLGQRVVAVLPGEHTVTFMDNGESVFNTVVTVSQGKTIFVQRHLSGPAKSSDAPPPGRERTDKPVPKEDLSSQPEKLISTKSGQWSSALKPLGIVTAGIGGALVISGIITGKLSLSKEKELSDSCPDKDNCPDLNRDTYSKGKSLGKATDVLLILGATLVVGGVILAIAGHKRQKSEKVVRTLPSVVVGHRAAGIIIGGSF